MEQERWKDIEGYGGLYQISDYGRVKSFNNNGWGKRKIGKLLSLTKNKNGYYQVSLHLSAKQKKSSVARLVVLHFIPNLENKPQVNHIDGVRANDHYTNLEWVTPSENQFHSYRVLHHPARTHSLKLTWEKIKEIRELYKTGKYSQTQLGRDYLISESCARNIIKNKTWIIQ